jgi:hypothetical protein
MDDRLSHMVATIAWHDPPPMAAASPAAAMEFGGIARGEESTEVQAQARRRMQVFGGGAVVASLSCWLPAWLRFGRWPALQW